MSKPVKKRRQAPASSVQAQTWWYATGIFALAVVLYANTFRHGYVLDDDLVCAKNTYVQEGISGMGKIFSHSWYHGFTGVEDRYYRPVMLTSLAIDNTMFGPDSHHVINVLIYGVSCALLYVLWVYLVGHVYTWLPLVAALLFAAHPLHTEVVANIKSRDELLALFFFGADVVGPGQRAKRSRERMVDPGCWFFHSGFIYQRICIDLFRFGSGHTLFFHFSDLEKDGPGDGCSCGYYGDLFNDP